jgi:hypothetical protein
MTDSRAVGLIGATTPQPDVLTVRHGAYVRRTWDREVPAAWNSLLYQHLPSSGPVVLMLAWEPGDPWRPVERWMVYETWARWWVAEHDPSRLAELEGPNPRRDVDHFCKVGWCDCVFKKNKMIYREGAYTPTKIDYWQWRFYQQHGRSPFRYWTIQGDDGGHRFALTPFESKLYQMTKGVSDTPAMGALPYADFTAQTLRHLVAYEPMRRKLLDMMWRSREAGIKAVEAEEEKTRIAQRTEAQSRLRETLGESAKVLNFAMRHADPYQRVYDGTREDRVAYGRANDPDEISHEFIHGD